MLESLRPAPENRKGVLIGILVLGVLSLGFVKVQMTSEVYDEIVYQGVIFVYLFLAVFISVLCNPTKDEIDLARIVGSVKFPGEELEAVRLENHQFERLFRVETTNAVEARTILTPLAMEGLVHFRDNFQALPSIAVSQNLAGVRISGTMPYEPIKHDGHLRSLDGYINSLKTACGMLDSLKNIIK